MRNPVSTYFEEVVAVAKPVGLSQAVRTSLLCSTGRHQGWVLQTERTYWSYFNMQNHLRWNGTLEAASLG